MYNCYFVEFLKMVDEYFCMFFNFEINIFSVMIEYEVVDSDRV